MAQTTWKCQRCGISDTHKDHMKVEMVGEKKPVAKRYHEACYTEHLKEKAFKEEERVKLDALNETIKYIYGVKDVPNPAWSLIQQLRNGEPVFQGKKHKDKLTKRYKEGYDYLLIRDTFEYCSETIEDANRRIAFDGFMGAFRYALTIIIDKIYVVEQRQKERERQEALVEKHIQELNESDLDFKSSFKKKNTSVDITEFLD